MGTVTPALGSHLSSAKAEKDLLTAGGGQPASGRSPAEESRGQRPRGFLREERASEAPWGARLEGPPGVRD